MTSDDFQEKATRKEKNIVQAIYKKIPNSLVVMLIDWEGNFMTHSGRESFFKVWDDELEYIARLASKRYKIAYFHRLLDGLDFTINPFREHVMIVTSYNESNLVLILPKEINLTRNIEIMEEIVCWSDERLANYALQNLQL